MKSDAPEYRIHSLFELLADASPHKTAVFYEDKSYTYRQLNKLANQLAHYLIDCGVTAGSPVGILLPRSGQLIVALLAVLKTGAVCVPLDPAYPAGRLTQMGKTTGLNIVITQSHLQLTLVSPGIHFIAIDEIDLDSEPARNLSLDFEADALAFILFTSGSTGRPKGVMRSHRSVVQPQKDAIAAKRMPQWVILMRSAISHISFVFEFVVPILATCPVVVARAGGERESRYLIELIRKHRITRIYLTPTLLRELLREPDFATCTSLERVGASGEPLPASLQERFFTLQSATLATTYGCTEYPAATAWDCSAGDIKLWSILGPPTPNTAFYLLDDQQKQVACGEAGEIYLGGVGLASGYWGRPDLTAQRFIANPFADEHAPTLYRTGDVARCRVDGLLEYVGRVADRENGRQFNGQVKIRGFRVELGEIEGSLDQHPLVDHCAVVAEGRGDDGDNQRIIAYFSSATKSTVTINELRQRLADKLPDFMIPAAFVRLHDVPLTPTGKIDRAALPSPDRSRPHQDEHFVAPREPVEKHLASIWRDVLQIDEIGVHDNFFVLGGDSLTAMQFINRLQDQMNVELSLMTLFDNPTIADLEGIVKLAGIL